MLVIRVQVLKSIRSVTKNDILFKTKSFKNSNDNSYGSEKG